MEIEKRITVTRYNVDISEDELRCIYKLIKKELKGQQTCDEATYHLHSELKRLFEQEDRTERETNKLADFILANCPDEIGIGNPQHGESAVDVAIRLIERLLPMLPRKTIKSDIVNTASEIKELEQHTNVNRKKKFEHKQQL